MNGEQKDKGKRTSGNAEQKEEGAVKKIRSRLKAPKEIKKY